MHHRDALGFRCAIHRGERHAHACLFNRQSLHALIQIVRQSGAAIGHVFQLGEEAAPQLAVALQGIGQHGKGDGGGPEYLGRYLAQIGNRLIKHAGDRLARIKIERAGIVEHVVEADIARGDVVPRHPFQRLRHLVRVDLLIPQRFLPGDHGAHHAMGLQQAFRHTGGPGGEEIFADGLMRDLLHIGDHGVPVDGRKTQGFVDDSIRRHLIRPA